MPPTAAPPPSGLPTAPASPDRPAHLLLVRHGESVGNVAATAAEASAAEVVDVVTRDADTPLSDRGVEQARALGRRLAALDPGDRPDAVWCSPYVRAHRTTLEALAAAGLAVPVRVDERLRDRELGITDRLTARGIAARLPDEAARRRLLGKMYYRPPGGESWADVALRLRSVLADVERLAAGRRVLVVTHDAVVHLVRYVLEELSEDQLLAAVRERSVRNASLTRLDPPADGTGPWRTVLLDDVGHLDDVPVTEHEGRGDA
ncbi:histidine phosphatase family protein [Cellulomonas endophytica]|uniref:histidine phosphatase family protein n=1 Tax=Cellulomonas endophytica TaxID=2494735 RepID=UPI0010122A3A|nr:histidine phosphatase family protein [Cellulomonas endophytica]